MRPFPSALLTALAIAVPLAAQPASKQVSTATDIPVEEWIAMAMGRTLTYRIDGALWALERYHPGTNRVTLQLYDGTCLEGTWEYAAPLYCFHWNGSERSCFRHARLGDEILIIETQDGADTTMLQNMTAVSDIPLACGPAVTS
jgi:hypothetical protein